MPPRRKLEPQPLIPGEDYWEKFLISQGLVGVITEEMQETEETIPKKPSGSEKELSSDMFTFAYRVSERLTSLDGLDQDARRRALKIREQFRKELTNVFRGKEDFNTWFNHTRTRLGIHMSDFIQILHECLEGLRSPEAKELRMTYAQELQKVRSMYRGTI